MSRTPGFSINNSLGLSFDFLENGLIKSISANTIRISLKTASMFSNAGANIFLRKEQNSTFSYTPLLGPESKSEFFIENNKFLAKGVWNAVSYECWLELSEKNLSWQWTIKTKNTSTKKMKLDIIAIQDAGLKTISDGLVNEYYVSQYIDRQILVHNKHGKVVCCRQNFKDAKNTPWLQLVSKNKAVSASTDGIQFYGKTYRETSIPESLLLPNLKGECAGELSIVALQEKPFVLDSDETHKSQIIGHFIENHSEATSTEDLKDVQSLFENFSNNFQEFDAPITFKPSANKFNEAVFLRCLDLQGTEISDLFSSDKRHEEWHNNELLSFFYSDNTHVVLKQKELLVDRPHGHILQAKAGFTPDENILSTTAYACGIFNSHITQGNTNFNRFLSLSSSQFNLEKETGQRIFIFKENHWFLLGIPSAYEIGLNFCRWIYKTESNVFQVRTWTSKTNAQVNTDFKVLKGDNVKFLITNHLDESINWSLEKTASNEFTAKPSKESNLGKTFNNPQFRIFIQNNPDDYAIVGNDYIYNNGADYGGSFFNVLVESSTSFTMSFLGEVVQKDEIINISNSDEQFLKDYNSALKSWDTLSSNISLNGTNNDVSIINDILPWYGINALTHLLTPHGLEQFDGAAWGTRDTTQGPFELLLKTEKYNDAKEILKIIFSHQNIDGTWPQWWMFDSYSSIRAGSSHGDVYHWCIIALADYIKASKDVGFLDEKLPYYTTDESSVEVTSLLEHTERLIKTLVDSFIDDKAFVPFGGGDWNDSMQPVSKQLSEKLVSSWTVALNYQAFTNFQEVYQFIGESKKAKSLQDICENIKNDFNTYLVKDNVVAGHGLFDGDKTSLLLHPSDTLTNIQYRLLPMIRGVISGIFTKEQAIFHLEIIEKYLKGPDGARLMNKPPKYNGGIQKIFQRAESSSFFGREIGVMYMHAHLRYAQTLAIMGNASGFIKALKQANPIEYNKVVSCGDYRQSNCYYSSSDVTFKNRYEADEKYEDLINGNIQLKGGWRIYSSGPGIYIGLIISHLLGFRSEYDDVIIDPVIPKKFDGLEATINFKGHHLNIKFNVIEDEYHPKKIEINTKKIELSYQQNQYRKSGVVLKTDYFLSFLSNGANEMIIVL
tara:strand:+ start:24927 stop:28283 length:3357 start_codon:yes stop_codon:yes gene_type:complete